MRKNLEQLKAMLACCTTCGMPLKEGKSERIMACADPTHGAFVITWSSVDNRYYVSYLLER
jgi:hypothetical protein